MNIITIIQAALTALNSDAQLFLLERSRAESEELNHTGDVIVVYPNWRTNNDLTQALELRKKREYNIVFKTLDEWDNSDDNLPHLTKAVHLLIELRQWKSLRIVCFLG